MRRPRPPRRACLLLDRTRPTPRLASHTPLTVRHKTHRGGPGGAGGGKDGHGGVEDVQQQQQLKKALFGALYTLAKEKINDSARMAYLAIGVDFILILGLFMMPEFPWSIDEHSP